MDSHLFYHGRHGVTLVVLSEVVVTGVFGQVVAAAFVGLEGFGVFWDRTD